MKNFEILNFFNIFTRTVGKVTFQDFPRAWIFRISLDRNPKNINWDWYAVRRALIPSFNCMKAGKNWLQFWQDASKTSLKFTRFNYRDSYLNQKAYGFVSPPLYDLSKIKERINLWMGQNECNLVRKDLDLLLGHLKNADINLTYVPEWGHTGIMFSKTREPFDHMIAAARKDMKV